MKKHAMVIPGLMGIVVLVACGGGLQQTTTTAPPPLPLAITTAAPPGGTVGISYAGSGFSLAASGGVAPYKWSWAAAPGSSLPSGLNLAPSGLISGTPQVALSYAVTVTVIDSAPKPAHASLDYQITVADVLTITSGAPPSGTVGTDYGPMLTQHVYCYATAASVGFGVACSGCTPGAQCGTLPWCHGVGNQIRPLPCTKITHVFKGFTFVAAGGIAPYTWSASGMPPGIDVDPNTGEILGTPTAAGTFNVLITVTDSALPQVLASSTYVIDIN